MKILSILFASSVAGIGAYFGWFTFLGVSGEDIYRSSFVFYFAALAILAALGYCESKA